MLGGIGADGGVEVSRLLGAEVSQGEELWCHIFGALEFLQLVEQAWDGMEAAGKSEEIARGGAVDGNSRDDALDVADLVEVLRDRLEGRGGFEQSVDGALA